MSAPVLWHLKASHYNEKARWALDYKGVPHLRRAAVPGEHAEVAERLSGGTTLPVLVLDGRGIGDSARIIDELEARYPDPPLYPADPGDRRHALALEEFFDEEFGPQVRLLVIHHMLARPSLLLGAFVPEVGGARRLIARLMFPAIRRRTRANLEINRLSVERAFERIEVVGRLFQDELQANGYLVGDGFTVADLTVAALCAPAVAPEQFPYPQPQRGHPLFAPVREALAPYGLLEWTREIYARHRGSSAEIAATDRAAVPATPAPARPSPGSDPASAR